MLKEPTIPTMKIQKLTKSTISPTADQQSYKARFKEEQEKKF